MKRWEEMEALKKQYVIDEKGYVEQHGLVTDKEIAVRLLCQTPDAWKVIDESLKNDPEVMMYYQPLGYVSWDYWYGSNNDVETGIYSEAELGMSYEEAGRQHSVGSVITPENGFEMDKERQFLPIGVDLGPYREMYLAIQHELMSNTNHRSTSEIYELFGYTDPAPKSEYNSSSTTETFERNHLPEIVQKYFQTMGEIGDEPKVRH